MSAALVLAPVSGVTLYRASAESPAMVRDVDLAELLGFERPRDVRKLIERNIDHLPGILRRATVARLEHSGNLPDSYTVDEFWLTIGQASFVVGVSAAKNKGPVMKALAEAFDASVALASAPSISNDAVALLAARLDRIEAALLSGRRGPRKALAPGQGTLFTTSVQERAPDPWEAPVKAFLATLRDDERVSIPDLGERVLQLNPFKLKREAASRIGVILSRSGWARASRPMINGRRTRLYRRGAQGEA